MRTERYDTCVILSPEHPPASAPSHKTDRHEAIAFPRDEDTPNPSRSQDHEGGALTGNGWCASGAALLVYERYLGAMTASCH
jgi:hypothetical protein